MSRWNELEVDPQDYPTRSRPKPRGGVLSGLARMTFALGAVAVVGGAVWFGLRHSATVTDDAGLPLIKADLRPLKSKPAQPGGEQVPDQEKLVFNRLDPDSAPPVVERLLPPPEVPLPRPVAPPPPPPVSTPVGAEPVGTVPRYIPESALAPPPMPLANPSAATAEGAAAASPPPPPVAAAAAPKPTVAAAKPAVPPSPASNPAKPAAAAPKPAVAAVVPGAPPPGSLSPSGGAVTRIQLGSVRSDAEAHTEWKRLQGRHADVLGGLSLTVTRADLGEKGVYYRLQAGPVDESRARGICAHLQSQNVGCQLVRH